MMRISTLVFTFLLGCFGNVGATNYYVKPTGNNSNNGITFQTAFATIDKGISSALADDTIYVASGTYTYTTGGTLKITLSGVNLIGQRGTNGERPLLDFSAMSLLSSNYGIVLSGSNCKIYGLDIKGAGDNGLSVSGSNNVIEFCSFFENRDTGCQLKGGASNNKVINCDSYYNVDAAQGNADGFAPKLDVGSGNYFKGCRAWQNSDDGWDGYLRPADDVTTTLENCWCFKNGYLKSGAASSGNGNGYKIGGSDLKDLRHNFILKNCLAFDNRVRGFDQNNNRGSMTLLNCTAINNGIDYYVDVSVLATGKVLTVTNCLTPNASNSNVALNGGVQTTNSWQSPFTCTSADFLSVSITLAEATAARKSDGSLPELSFMHLKQGSDLIDVGTNVGLPFNGPKPDLGCFETSVISGLVEESLVEHVVLGPNPCEGILNIQTNGTLDGTCRILNAQGVVLGQWTLTGNSSTIDLAIFSAGIYVVNVTSERKSRTFSILLKK